MYSQHTIVGRVGRAPELRYTQAGVAVCDFSVAVNKVIGSGDNRRETTTWYKVSCWRQLAEIVHQHVTKGMQVLVSGDELAASAYTDKSGNPAASLELTARDVRFLGGGEPSPIGNSDNDTVAPPAPSNDIPF